MTAAAGRHGNSTEPGRKIGRLFVLSGPSGVGKSTVLARLRSVLPDLWFSVSATTRGPRPGDVEGESYFFVTRDEFTAMVDSRQMLEWAEFAGNLYGTPLAPVAEHLAAGQDVLLEIEVQGARQVRAALAESRSAPNAEVVLLFLAPPSFEELARRLVGRGTEPPEVQQARLVAARSELAAECEFDHTVINHDVESAVQALVELAVDQRIRPGP